MIEAYTSIENSMRFYGAGSQVGAQIPFNFELITYLNSSSDAFAFKTNIMSWMNLLPTGQYANWVVRYILYHFNQLPNLFM